VETEEAVDASKLEEEDMTTMTIVMYLEIQEISTGDLIEEIDKLEEIKI
jgi:hypothetical protein